MRGTGPGCGEQDQGMAWCHVSATAHDQSEDVPMLVICSNSIMVKQKLSQLRAQPHFLLHVLPETEKMQ